MTRRRPDRHAPYAAWLSILAACTFLSSAVAQGPPRAVTMHRQQAGVPNANGWYDARSTEGHFRVSLPIPFNDFTVKAKEKDGREAETYVVGSTSSEGFKFSATEFRSMTRKFDLKAFGEKFKADKAKTVSNETFFEFGGHPAVQFHVSDGRNSAFMRAIVFPSSVFLLIVEYPAKSEREILPLVQPFLSSLKVADTL